MLHFKLVLLVQNNFIRFIPWDSCSKGTQGNSRELKRTQENSRELKRTQKNSRELKGTQGIKISIHNCIYFSQDNFRVFKGTQGNL